jgi:uncharacterized protein YndB with AHSA1/START domain
MDATPIIKEVSINAPVAKVWKAITDRDDMKQWYFNLAEFKPEVGFRFSFTGGDENVQFVHNCTITEVVPMQKLSYTWEYEVFPGVVSVVTFELFEENGGTRVKLTHTGTEQFKTDNPMFARASFTAGWNDIIGQNLKKFAEQ